MKSTINYLGIILTSLVALGCATEPAPIDPRQLDQAAEKIVRDKVFYMELFARCAALGDEVEVDAINAQQDWIIANAPLVAAADAYYSQQQAANSFEHQGKSLAPNAIKLNLEAIQAAENELSLEKRSPNNQRKTCAFKLAQMTPATMALTNQSLIAKSEQALMAFLPLDTSIAKVPSLAGGIRATPAGKSFYKIDKNHQSECANASTLVIANNWPQEAYATFCGDKATQVLLCDWGKCTAKKL